MQFAPPNCRPTAGRFLWASEQPQNRIRFRGSHKRFSSRLMVHSPTVRTAQTNQERLHSERVSPTSRPRANARSRNKRRTVSSFAFFPVRSASPESRADRGASLIASLAETAQKFHRRDSDLQAFSRSNV